MNQTTIRKANLGRFWPARLVVLGALVTLVTLALPSPASGQIGSDDLARQCQRVLSARVVALDQVYYWNRYGAVEPQGMIYALERDVVHKNQNQDSCDAPLLALQPGQVQLRRGKRPRPLTLRMNVGDCLRITFRNLLSSQVVDQEQPSTRAASIHVAGLEYVSGMSDAGVKVGTNTSSGVVDPGQQTVYTLHATKEGTFLMYSGGAMVGGQGDGGSISAGLFGAVNVQPRGSEWYRSQVTEEDLSYAITNTYPAADLFPTIDYDATYPAINSQCRPGGSPILRMLDANREVVHSDLTAIITGPNRGHLLSSSFQPVTNILPNRTEPYREFTIIFHDEIGAVQAFPHFQDEVLSHTLHSARDAFAINYGTGGIGAEILANRLGVGPPHECVECKYEEFFLSSWVVGDPAMVVDIPANHPCTVSDLKKGINCQPTPGPKATKAFYPDDPSNVYHSYLNDHVKFRNLHAGIDDHHIFHLHAHQWLHTPENDESSYHDSQAIGQGGAWTYEIAYNGSGNRNKTVGDSIFHCHFYPHFAQGMWSLWRVHDVLETGTVLDDKGRPRATLTKAGVVTTTRALPDPEIRWGTPIPAIVPIPGKAMAPVPAPIQLVDGQPDLSTTPNTNPGYPFFIPATVGHRPPHPPLDTLDDGGLSRHVITDGRVAFERHDRLSFEKVLGPLEARWLDEAGEKVEEVAMKFHSAGSHATQTPDGSAEALFIVNNQPPRAGAPFADPCVNDQGGSIPVTRTYKAANIDMDIVLNKSGWHFPQSRLITLWGDVRATLANQRPPEPFFFRANSGECIEYHHTNLTTNEYHLDDFQVRTPTDILGQHIHLVKFDVLASDGGGNGFNYEDGTFSPEEVQERILGIREWNHCAGTIHGGDARDGTPACPVIESHPYFPPEGVDHDCDGHDDWEGAQTTVQRWWADPVRDNNGVDRTLHTIFTHDHFGPSTHQQTGLYAGLIIEPSGSQWLENEGPGVLGGRFDGGPTSWQARIQPPNSDRSFREFALGFADFQLAYKPNNKQCPHPQLGWADPANAINPPARRQVGLPRLYEKAQVCPINDCDPDGPYDVNPFGLGLPCPEAVSADDPGTGSVNYRNEPLALRVRNPSSNTQTTGQPGDLSFAYESRTDRADSDLNGTSSSHVPYPDLTRDIQPGDAFTPTLRAYENDEVKVRVLVGAHEEEHNFTLHGLKWLQEPDDKSSGWRNGQMAGISEYYDYIVRRMPSLTGTGKWADFLYKPSASNDFQWNGVWGMMRLYRGDRSDLQPLPNNIAGRSPLDATDDASLFKQVDVIAPDDAARSVTTRILCPPGATVETLRITATTAAQALPGGVVTYNRRPDTVAIYDPDDPSLMCADPDQLPPPPIPSPVGFRQGPIVDPSAILFVRTADLDSGGRLRPGIRVEPLILRALPDRCLRVQLNNAIDPNVYRERNGYSALPMIVENFNSNELSPSMEVGLHPQLVSYDIRQGDGYNVGTNRVQFNLKQTAAPGETVTYFWYTGHLLFNNSTQSLEWQPMEYGVTALVSSDPIKHTQNGAVGALVIEPEGSSWVEDLQPAPSITPSPGIDLEKTYASATVTTPDGPFREFVVIYQDDLNLHWGSARSYPAINSLAVNEDAQETGQIAMNYRTDPIWFRMGYDPSTDPGITRRFTNYDDALLNSFIGGADPETPVFRANPGTPVRFRVVHPGGDTQNHSFEVQGHIWQEQPFQTTFLSSIGSDTIGTNSTSNWRGIADGIGPASHLNVLLRGGAGAGGRHQGDYLYRDYVPWVFHNGFWGILRVVSGPIP